jgi:thymidylate synthase ThyX
MMFDANPNALINMAKARMCLKAAKETREVISLIKKNLLEGDTYDCLLGEALVPPCEWYDKCFEPKPCGRFKV